MPSTSFVTLSPQLLQQPNLPLKLPQQLPPQQQLLHPLPLPALVVPRPLLVPLLAPLALLVLNNLRQVKPPALVAVLATFLPPLNADANNALLVTSLLVQLMLPALNVVPASTAQLPDPLLPPLVVPVTIVLGLSTQLVPTAVLADIVRSPLSQLP